MNCIRWIQKRLSISSYQVVERCDKEYIPIHLHTNGKKPIKRFYKNEKLFWRWADTRRPPFADVNLRDVSLNRSGIKCRFLSTPKDVLWNLEITDKRPFQKFDCEIVQIDIIKIFPNKISRQVIHESHIAIMTLAHDPLPCNYAHSIIIFEVNNVRITEENYESNFKSKPYKKLRQSCRDEISKAIIQKAIFKPGLASLMPPLI
jgi:hypothetical protein